MSEWIEPVTIEWIQAEYGITTPGDIATFMVRPDMYLTWSAEEGAELRMLCGVTATVSSPCSKGNLRDCLERLGWKKPEPTA